jgi:molecular chaperone DnaK
VAAGYETSKDGLDAAIWTSKDGSSWIPLTLTALEGPGDQQIQGAATLEEQLILAGSSASESGDLDAAVWVRSDGRWTKVSDISLGGSGDQQIGAIVAGASGLVAVGSDTSGGDLDAAVWTSGDGRDWDRVPVNGTTFGGAGDQMMSTVTWVGTTLVAGGSSASVGRDPDGAIWVSTDGERWKRVPAMNRRGPERISSLVSIEADRLLATGSQEQAQDVQAAAWIAQLASDPSP